MHKSEKKMKVFEIFSKNIDNISNKITKMPILQIILIMRKREKKRAFSGREIAKKHLKNRIILTMLLCTKNRHFRVHDVILLTQARNESGCRIKPDPREVPKNAFIALM